MSREDGEEGIHSLLGAGFMLTSDPTARPNIQQVQERLATLRGVPMKHNPSQTSPTRSTNTNNMLSDSHVCP